MIRYIRQVIFELRNHPLMTWVSVSGTALAIFLIMAVFMSERVKTVEMTPESNRNRILIGQGIHIFFQDNENGSMMEFSRNLAEKLYSNLEGIETISYINRWFDNSDVTIDYKRNINLTPMGVDEEFWKIYDFKFIEGRPFTKEEAESRKFVVIPKQVARTLFGEEKVAGKTIMVDDMPKTVSGVIEDVHPLLSMGQVGLFLGISILHYKDYDKIWGNFNTILLMKPGVEASQIKKEVENRYNLVNRELAAENVNIQYHKQPYTALEMGVGDFGSNNGPDIESHNKVLWITYSILILLPAINLSSMTRSRLRRRVSEIGLRRAFGARKRDIIGQIFTENLIITLIGGIIGLVVSLLFFVTISQYFFIEMNQSSVTELAEVNIMPVLSGLFDWRTFFITFGLCFVLNILSATVPAWQASRVEPSVAISKSKL